MQNFVLLAASFFLVINISCKKKSSKSTTNAQTDSLEVSLSDEFPNFYQLAVETAPAVTSTSQLDLPLALANFPTDYTTTSSDFLTAFSVDQNYIGQVLNDAGEQGPVKSIYVLLAQVQSTLNNINSMTVNEEVALVDGDDEGDSEGEGAMTCSKITSTKVSTPFFSDATNDAFNAWEDSGKYTCLADDNDEGVFAFGSTAITNPPEACETKDAFEFFVMEGSASDDDENTEQVATRGNKVDRAGIKKFYYNGCTGDLNIMYAQTTLYSAGVEFSSRTELSGNTLDKTFSLRSNFIDADTGYATHNTFVGHGKSRKASANDDDAYFIMGYRSDSCGNSSNSSTCSLGTAKSFCVKNEGTGNDLALAADSAQCADYQESYGKLDILVRSDLPTGYFEVTPKAAGL